MARIRTVKPEFWVSEQVIACSPNARLLFIGLWNFCDDGGVHPAEYIRVKAEIFPTDPFTVNEIKKWIAELIINGLVREYFIGKKAYWIVTGWKNHQRINRPTPLKHPQPESDFMKINDNHLLTQPILTEPSLLAHPIDSGKGREGIGEERDIYEVETPLSSFVEENTTSNTRAIFEYWQAVMNHPKAKLDHKRKRIITQAFKSGYSTEDLKQAIDGCANTPYNMGKNDAGQIYDDISLILRDADHIERFMNNSNRDINNNELDHTSDLMTGVI
ncbi:TPA: hypothetical protein ACPSKY_002568 [Legionella bozemanae]